jgi:hypothetical protein
MYVGPRGASVFVSGFVARQASKATLNSGPSRNYPDAPPGYLQIPEEESTWRRFSPKRHRWQDVAAFDDRVLELDKRAEAVMAHAAAVHDQLLSPPSVMPRHSPKRNSAEASGPRRRARAGGSPRQSRT